jgi:hypothetical protein
MKGVEYTALGIVLLMGSLAIRHLDPLHWGRIVDALHWTGAIAVVVGLAMILFLEER